MRRPDATPHPLSAYVGACRHLSVELADAIADSSDEGRETVYASDFSELYAFAKPNETAAEFQLLPDEDSSVSGLLQAVALDRLFFNGEPVFLLPPYAIELSSHMKGWQRERAISRIAPVRPALREWEALRKTERYREVQALADRVVHSGEELSDAECSRVFDFFAGNAESLLRTLFPTAGSYLDRLRLLLDHDRLRNPPVEVNVDLVELSSDERVRFWIDRFADSKSDLEKTSVWLDALAVVQCQDINLTFGPRRRVVLITRSRRMLDAYRAARDEGLEESRLIWVRHPRSVAHAFVARRMGPNRAVGHLEQRKRAVDRFIQVMEDTPADKAPGQLQNSFARLFLEEIRRDHEKTSILETYLSEVDSPSVTPDRRPARARELLDLVRNDGSVHGALMAQLDDCVDELVQNYEQFGFVYHTNAMENIRTLQNAHLSQERFGEKRVMKAMVTGVPYTLEFFSQNAIDMVSTFLVPGSPSRVRLKRAGELIKELVKGEEGYERLLLMAFIFGCLHEWDWASEYCERALEVGAEQEIFAHEAFFYLALCQRKKGFTRETYLRALDLLKRALTAKRERMLAKGDGGKSRDPRYLKEMGTATLIYHRTAGPEAVGDGPIPGPEKGKKWLEEALRLCEDDDDLRLRILNNIVFHAVEERDALGLEERWKHYQRFLRLIEAREREGKDVPGSVVHTRALAKWLLKEGDIGGIEDELEKAAADASLDEAQRQVVLADLAMIKHEMD